jgi:membrane protein DedA with SNARE-associated domain
VLLAALVAGIAGAFVQYLLARGPGRGFIYRFGRYAGLTPARLDRAAAAVEGRGWLAVALGRALPGLRIGAVAACGLAAMPLATFIPGLIAGTLLFAGVHTLLGYAAGPGVVNLFNNLNIPLWPFLLALALFGLAGWLLLQRRVARRAEADVAVFDWADACCPACLAAASVERRLNLAPGKQPAQEVAC